jgi:hypothetical protein
MTFMAAASEFLRKTRDIETSWKIKFCIAFGQLSALVGR